jgi:hypothetical protein
MTVREYCVSIRELLIQTEEYNWVKLFNNFIEDIEHNEENKYRNILKIYGGMGSFNDLVLYKDGKPCIRENNELSQLRTALYSVISNNLLR